MSEKTKDIKFCFWCFRELHRW